MEINSISTSQTIAYVPKINYQFLSDTPSVIYLYADGQKCSFFVDSGSQLSLIKSKFVKCDSFMQNKEYLLTGITGHCKEALGTSEIRS